MTNPSRGKLGSCLNESFAEKATWMCLWLCCGLLQVMQFGRIAESLDLP